MYRFLLRLLLLLGLLGGVVSTLFAQATPLRNAVVIESTLKEKTVLVGQAFETEVKVANQGTETVRSIGYTCEFGGIVSAEQVYHLPIPLNRMGAVRTLRLSIPGVSKTGLGKFVLRIKSVNGQPNEATQTLAAVSNYLAVSSHSAKRKVLVEDFTATWCPLCPLAMGAMESLSINFKDRVIPIAIHGWKDVMFSQDYAPLVRAYVGGFPEVRINRYKTSRTALPRDYKKGESYDLLEDIEAEERAVTEAAIKITKATLDPEKDRVNIETQTTFGMSGEESPYRLAYVLTADGLKGTSKYWTQANAYLDPSDLRFLPSAFTNASSPVYPEFNHTVVRASDVLQGDAGTLPASFQEGRAYSHVHGFDVSNTESPLFPGEHIIQDKSKLHAVVLLINTRTRHIVNADSAPVELSTQDKSVQLELGESGMCTLATPRVLTVPVGARVSAVLPAAHGQLRLETVATAGQHLPAETGFLVEAAPGTRLTFAPAPAGVATVALPTGHLLHPALSAARVHHLDEKLYILANDAQSGLGFYRQKESQGDWVEQLEGKAYLALPRSQAAAQGYTFRGGLLTGIQTLATSTAKTSTSLYDLSGRRVLQPAPHGVYLRGGRKVLR